MKKHKVINIIANTTHILLGGLALTVMLEAKPLSIIQFLNFCFVANILVVISVRLVLKHLQVEFDYGLTLLDFWQCFYFIFISALLVSFVYVLIFMMRLSGSEQVLWLIDHPSTFVFVVSTLISVLIAISPVEYKKERKETE